MLIIITSPKKFNDLITKYKNNNFLFLNTPCNIKKIKGRNNVLLIDSVSITNEGLIEEYNILLDELFISKDFMLVITNLTSQKLIEECKFYKVTLINLGMFPRQKIDA